MKKNSRIILLSLSILISINIWAQNLITVQKQDSIIPVVLMENGRAQVKNLFLFTKSTTLENLFLEICLPHFKQKSTFVQTPIRIEVERQNNGKLERIEIARFFLPWLDEKTKIVPKFVFDITSYSLLFNQNIALFIESNTNAQPLELQLQFTWKMGQSSEEVNQIISLWRSDIPGLPYSDKTKPINKQLKSRSIKISKTIKYALLKIYLSGSGSDNSFPSEADCSKFYFLNINGITVEKRPIWRDDCGLNALFPQSGSWMYSRANWCPGQALRVYDHYIPLGTDTTLKFELHFQEEIKGTQLLKNYLLSANLILMEGANYENDAAIAEILAPNKNLEHSRYNPICSSPVIRVRNTGTDTLRSVMIEYGLDNKTDNRYRWRGELAFMEEEIVYLPPPNWYFYDQKNKPSKFSVSIKAVNNKVDEYEGNNRLFSELNLAPVFPNKISIRFSAHKTANENIIELVDEMGLPLFEASGFVNDSLYTYNLDLQPGCYELVIYDQMGDGIDIKSNIKEKGIIKIIETNSKKELKDFETNFGAEIRQQFMILK